MVIDKAIKGLPFKHPGALVALGAVFFLSLLLPSISWGVQGRYPTPRPATLSFFEQSYDGRAPELSDTALEGDLLQDVLDISKSLGKDPSDLFAYVWNYAWEPFYGILKGPDGALKTGSGSTQDLSSLLLVLLRAQNIPARLIKADMELPAPVVMNLLGVTTKDAASRIIQASNLNDHAAFDDQNNSFHFKDHTLVAAFIKGKWLLLDPSIKQYDRTGATDPLGLLGEKEVQGTLSGLTPPKTPSGSGSRI